MTFIQHNRSGRYPNLLLGVLVALAIGASVELVLLYNRTVNLRHQITQVREEIIRTETANAELKEEIFAILDSDKFQTFAAERGLVQDRDPRYFEVDRQWSIASQR